MLDVIVRRHQSTFPWNMPRSITLDYRPTVGLDKVKQWLESAVEDDVYFDLMLFDCGESLVDVLRKWADLRESVPQWIIRRPTPQTLWMNRLWQNLGSFPKALHSLLSRPKHKPITVLSIDENGARRVWGTPVQ